jgi:hypothetical protein
MVNRMKNLPSAMLAALLITGCASAPPPNFPGQEVAGIAVSVDLTVQSSWTSWMTFNPLEIYFIRIDAGDGITSRDLIRSNHVSSLGFMSGAYAAYLLNAKPGRYAAVAAYGTTSDNKEFVIFFPEGAIRESIIEVRPGRFYFMGTVDLKTASGMKDADEAQMYYYRLLSGREEHDGAVKELFLRSQTMFAHTSYAAPALNRVHRSAQEEMAFLHAIRGSFESTDWISLIDARMGALRAEKK